MSIVTLKRKSNAIHSNVSKNGFYLNGKLRMPPPTLIRTPVRTSMKGTAPHGYGTGSDCRVSGIYGRSCKHSYNVVIRSTGCCTPQTEVKKSTKNTSGYLSTHFSGIFHGAYPKSMTASFPSLNSSDVIQNNVQNTLACDNAAEKEMFNCQITKPTQSTTKVSYDMYMQTLKQNCKNSTKPNKVWHTCLLI